jgi:hypothetical protein
MPTGGVYQEPAPDGRPAIADALDPIMAVLRTTSVTRQQAAGLAPGLLVADAAEDWLPASSLIDGTRLPELLAAARDRWHAAPHAAASLAWKAYSYWLSLPVVVGWAAARRVPLVDPADVLVRFSDQGPLVAIGLRPTVGVAVLPSDPLASPLGGPDGKRPGIRVAGSGIDDPGKADQRDPKADQRDPSEADRELLAVLRESLLGSHLMPLLDAIRGPVRVGQRPLLGSVASGVGHAILRTSDALPGSAVGNVGTLLDALGLDDLIDLVPGPSGGLMVARRTCCLAFTLPKPKICAGCRLRRR